MSSIISLDSDYDTLYEVVEVMRDNNDIITSYLVKDLSTDKVMAMSPAEVKTALNSRKPDEAKAIINYDISSTGEIEEVPRCLTVYDPEFQKCYAAWKTSKRVFPVTLQETGDGGTYDIDEYSDEPTIDIDEEDFIDAGFLKDINSCFYVMDIQPDSSQKSIQSVISDTYDRCLDFICDNMKYFGYN